MIGIAKGILNSSPGMIAVALAHVGGQEEPRVVDRDVNRPSKGRSLSFDVVEHLVDAGDRSRDRPY